MTPYVQLFNKECVSVTASRRISSIGQLEYNKWTNRVVGGCEIFVQLRFKLWYKTPRGGNYIEVKLNIQEHTSNHAWPW